MTDLLVLRRGVHGMPIEQYAAALRDRLPDRDVAVARTPDAERERITDVPVATGRAIDAPLVERAADLKLFACAYAGHDHLPMGLLEEQGVAVTTASGVHAPNVAEHALGAILADTRGFERAMTLQRADEWRHFQVDELHGTTATVVGLGAIGSAVVTRLAAFGVETIGIRRHPDRGGPADEVVGSDALHEALAQSSVVVLTCPLTEETHHLLSTAEFETMDPGVYLVNVARGPVVDTEALVSALRTNGIGGATLDVTDPEPLPDGHPLWTLGNVRITPHNAGHTPKYYDRLAEIVAANLRHAAETGRYENLTNQVV